MTEPILFSVGEGEGPPTEGKVQRGAYETARRVQERAVAVACAQGHWRYGFQAFQDVSNRLLGGGGWEGEGVTLVYRGFI